MPIYIFIYNFFSLFVDICKVAGDCDEILFSPDGSWAPLGVPGKDTKPVIAQNGVAKQSTSQNSPTVKQQTSITKIGKAKFVCQIGTQISGRNALLMMF